MVCPFDHGELKMTVYNEKEEEVFEGMLTCEHCQRYYPIVQGIAIMTPDEYREIKFELPLLERWGEQVVIKEGKAILASQLKSHV